ncbi:MAG: hypothetical protein RLZ77_1435 [Bacteroidota bacterium]
MGKQEIIASIINSLKTDPFYAVSLYNESELGRQQIGVNLTRQFMESNAGSVEEYFNRVFESGVKKLGIQVRRQNGRNPSKGITNYKPIGDYQVLELSANKMEVQQPVQPKVETPFTQEVQPVLPVIHHAQVMPSYGMRTPNMGLSMPEVINLHVDKHERQRLEREIAELRPKYEALQDKVKDYERRERDWTDKKASAESNASMLGMIMENIDKVPALISALKPGSVPSVPSGGLSMPANATQEQQNLCNWILDNDPSYANWILNILSKSENQEFVNELEELIKKHSA